MLPFADILSDASRRKIWYPCESGDAKCVVWETFWKRADPFAPSSYDWILLYRNRYSLSSRVAVVLMEKDRLFDETCPLVVTFALADSVSGDVIVVRPLASIDEFEYQICSRPDTYQFWRVWGWPRTTKWIRCLPSRKVGRKGVRSIRYVGRSKVRCPTSRLQNPKQIPPVNTTSNGHTAPTGSLSTNTSTSLNAPCPENDIFHALKVST
jgi:hypothetical protein